MAAGMRTKGQVSELNPVDMWETSGMKKPVLRVVQWLGDIPVEAECRTCGAAARFRAASTGHRPNREEFTRQLQQAFDQHVKLVHSSEDPKPVE